MTSTPLSTKIHQTGNHKGSMSLPQSQREPAIDSIHKFLSFAELESESEYRRDTPLFLAEFDLEPSAEDNNFDARNGSGSHADVNNGEEEVHLQSSASEKTKIHEEELLPTDQLAEIPPGNKLFQQDYHLYLNDEDRAWSAKHSTTDAPIPSLTPDMCKVIIATTNNAQAANKANFRTQKTIRLSSNLETTKVYHLEVRLRTTDSMQIELDTDNVYY